MASGIAHDFNNALMPILGFSEMLLSDQKMLDDREGTLNLLRMIEAAGEDARHIVQRLREIYKEEEVDYQLVDLAKVVETSLALTTPKWKAEMNARGATVEMVTKFAKAPLIKGDVNELREALTNLIFNAVDAMPGGGTITLLLNAGRGRSVVLEVSDTGGGMDESALRHCIEPFFTTKGKQGTGLGLSMVNGIVQRHGGVMEIESKPGEGTTIRMRFPVPVEIEGVAEPELEPEVLDPMRVLIVDDDARSRNLILRILQADGHDVTAAGGGPEGLTMFGEKEFDLVITNRAMPLMSGDDVAGEISRIREGMPVIMLTGFGDAMNDAGELPAGVTRVMTKPITSRDLKRVMASVMNGQSP
jgi:CheY-like chemotaxis protein